MRAEFIKELSMIFVTLGSQKFQFDRLLKKLDKLIEDQILQDSVFAQTGYCDYVPVHFSCEKFLNREEFGKQMQNCDLVITHGGTGAIVSAVKKGKKVIAVPRLAKYGEHVDDHQIQILKQFEEMNLILPCYELECLGEKLEEIKDMEFPGYISNTEKIIQSIEKFIEDM